MKMQTVLIYNRGEIAKRAIETALKLNLKPLWLVSKSETDLLMNGLCETIVVEDAQAPYMNLELLESILKEKNIDALYPGYGFLSESYELADLCLKYKVNFIGPSKEAIKALGSKRESLNFAKDIGVKILEYKKDEEYDYPILLKASMGGGGRGNLIVHSKEELESKREQLVQKSQELFGDSDIMAERYIPDARHVELQVMATKDDVFFLSTRDCSLQYNYQKFMEEGPSCHLSREAVAKLYPKMKQALLAMNYLGAGTVEFLWDIKRKELYFLEVNTRIQVEHPVTEELLSQEIDLVETQFKVAQGHGVNIKSDITGHSICARIYAVDPYDQFAPSVGTIYHLNFPDGIRVDTYLNEGTEVTTKFDPMIAKIIIKEASREECIEKLKQVLKETYIFGIKTNIPYLLHILNEESFVKDKHHISWAQQEIDFISHSEINNLSLVQIRSFFEEESASFAYRDFYRKKYLR